MITTAGRVRCLTVPLRLLPLLKLLREPLHFDPVAVIGWWFFPLFGNEFSGSTPIANERSPIKSFIHSRVQYPRTNAYRDEFIRI